MQKMLIIKKKITKRDDKVQNNDTHDTQFHKELRELAQCRAERYAEYNKKRLVLEEQYDIKRQAIIAEHAEKHRQIAEKLTEIAKLYDEERAKCAETLEENRAHYEERYDKKIAEFTDKCTEKNLFDHVSDENVRKFNVHYDFQIEQSKIRYERGLNHLDRQYAEHLEVLADEDEERRVKQYCLRDKSDLQKKDQLHELQRWYDANNAALLKERACIDDEYALQVSYIRNQRNMLSGANHGTAYHTTLTQKIVAAGVKEAGYSGVVGATNGSVIEIINSCQQKIM